MKFLYFLLPFLIAVLIDMIIKKRKGRRFDTSSESPEPGASGVTLRCPHCLQIVHNLYNEAYHGVYGQVFRFCDHCGKEYYDKYYHELSLTTEEKRNRCYSYESGLYETELAASRARLDAPGYAAKLYELESDPSVMNVLKNRIDHQMHRYLNLLYEKTGAPLSPFQIKNFSNTFDKITYEAHDPAAVSRLAGEVLTHYGIRPDAFKIVVDYLPASGTKSGTRGSFQRGTLTGGTIHIALEPEHSEYDTVISIVLHECAHAFLALKGISLDDPFENECLTDAAAIYLGGGSHILRGYFSSSFYRIGYLLKPECEIAHIITEQMRFTKEKNAASEKAKALSLWHENCKKLRSLLYAIEEAKSRLKPAQILREESIEAEFFRQWKESEDAISKASEVMTRLTDCENASEAHIKNGNELAQPLIKQLNAFLLALKEWQDAEDYQSLLPAVALETVRGVKALAENNNAFAILERIRFWSACPATGRDAEICLCKLHEINTPDALCAIGVCFMKGLAVSRDSASARDFLTRAAEQGSQDAKKLLTSFEA